MAFGLLLEIAFVTANDRDGSFLLVLTKKIDPSLDVIECWGFFMKRVLLETSKTSTQQTASLRYVGTRLLNFSWLRWRSHRIDCSQIFRLDKSCLPRCLPRRLSCVFSLRSWNSSKRTLIYLNIMQHHPTITRESALYHPWLWSLYKKRGLTSQPKIGALDWSGNFLHHSSCGGLVLTT